MLTSPTSYQDAQLILGIDPSLRHTGLCLLGKGDPFFTEFRPTHPDVLSAVRHLREELKFFLDIERGKIEAYAIEKQLSVGGRMSPMLFYVQMTVLDCICHDHPDARDPRLVMPMPVQLQSYIVNQHAYKGTSDSELVHHFKRQTGFEGRISIHCVDAYYTARLAQDVLAGKWRYNKPTKEVPLTPYPTVNGD